MTNPQTIAAVAAYLQVSPGVIKGLVKRGRIRARRDGLISNRALTTFIHRQQRITRRYCELYAGGRGLSAREAWAQAQAEDDRRQGLVAARKVSAILARRDVQVTTCTHHTATKTSGQPATIAAARLLPRQHQAPRHAATLRTIGGRR